MNDNLARQILNQTTENYRKLAEEFSATRAYPWSDLQALNKYFENVSSVLDLACGNGRVYELFRNKDINYTGIDNCEKLIEIAKERYSNEINPPQFLIGDVLNLPFKEEKFDLILAVAALHLFPTKELQRKVLTETRRVLKPDGILILTCWNLWQPKYFFKQIIQRVKKPFLYRGFGWQDFLIPWKMRSKEIVWRYYRAFTKSQIKNLIQSQNFKILEIYYSCRGQKASRLKGHNLILIGQKV